MARVVLVENPFSARVISVRDVPADAPLGLFLPADWQRENVAGVLNGKQFSVRDIRTLRLSDQDILTLCRLPGWATPLVTLPLIGTITVGNVIVAGTLLALSVGMPFVTAAMGPKPENLATYDNSEQSPTYGWAGIQNTTRNGTIIPLVYGKHKVGGQVIAAYTQVEGNNEHYLYVLLGLAAGEIEAINRCTQDRDAIQSGSLLEDLKLDDNSASEYEGIQVYYRLGSWEQEPIPGFRRSHIQTSINTELQYDSAYIHTANTPIQEVTFQIRFPSGLYMRDSKGAIRQYDVDFLIEKKLPSETTWTTVGTYTASARNTSQYNYEIRIPGLDLASYQFRITRQTQNDAEVSAAQGLYPVSKSYLLAITETTYDDVAYKGVALLGLRALATEQLNGRMPRITSIIYGKKVKRYKPGDLFGPDTQQDFTTLTTGSDAIPGHWGWHVEKVNKLDIASTHVPSAYSLTLKHKPEAGSYYWAQLTVPYVYKKIYGDFDLRVRVNWKEGYSVAGRGVMLLVRMTDPAHNFSAFGLKTDSSGTLKLFTRANVANAPTIWHGDAPSNDIYLRAVADSDTGSLTFYASTDGETWTQYGDSLPWYSDYQPWDVGICLEKEDSGDETDFTAVVKEFEFADSTCYSLECSNNPAWVIYDLLTDDHYGAGAYISESDIDLESFLAFAAYCDEQVTDGRGGLEARYRCDVVIDSAKSIWEQALGLLENYNASLVKVGNTIRVVYLHEQSPVQLFSMANIAKGSFSVTYAAKELGANYWELQFLNAENDWAQDYAVYQDPDLETAEPLRGKTANLYGVTRPGEAFRAALFRCKQNRYQRKLIKFSTGVEAIVCEPYDVISVQHDVPRWGVSSGRVVTATGSTITLDKPVTLEEGKSYEIKVRHNDDSIETATVVINTPGTYSTLQVSGWTSIPIPDEMWVLGQTSISTSEFVVTRIERTGDLECTIEAVEYNPAIYDPTITHVPFVSRSELPDPRKLPDNVSEVLLMERTQLRRDGTVNIAIEVAWPAASGADKYEIWFREYGRAAWIYAGETSSLHFTINDRITEGSTYTSTDPFVEGNKYEVAVVSVSSFGAKRRPDNSPRQIITIKGRESAPSNVDSSSINIARVGTVLSISWGAVDDKDLKGYEVRYAESASWDDGVVMATNIPTPYLETVNFPVGTWYFMVKAINTSGVYSLQAASLQYTVPSGTDETLDWSRDERALSWPGTKNALYESSGDLVVSSGFTSAFYMTPSIDTGSVHTQRLRAAIAGEQIVGGYTWDQATFAWDSDTAKALTWDTAQIGEVATLELYVRYGDTENEMFNNEFEPFRAGEFNTRWFQFLLAIRLDSEAVGGKITQLKVEAYT